MIADPIVQISEARLIAVIDDIGEDCESNTVSVSPLSLSLSLSSVSPHALRLHDPVNVGCLTLRASFLQLRFGAGDLIIIRSAYLFEVVIHQRLDARLHRSLLLL